MDVLGYCAPHFRKPPSRSVSRKKWLLWDAHVSISTIHGAHTHIHTARTGETSSKYVEIGNPRIHGIDVICLVVTIWLHHIASGCCLRHTQTQTQTHTHTHTPRTHTSTHTHTHTHAHTHTHTPTHTHTDTSTHAHTHTHTRKAHTHAHTHTHTHTRTHARTHTHWTGFKNWSWFQIGRVESCG